MKQFFAIGFVSLAKASHFDDIDGVFTNYAFDQVKFKTQTNC